MQTVYSPPENDRYQMWGYLRNDPDVSKHRQFADWCSHAQAIQMRDEAERDHTVNYLMDHMYGEGFSQEIIYYVRKYGDPTYLLYSQHENEKKYLYGMYFDERTANAKLEFLTEQVQGLNRRNNLNITAVLETRDDSIARDEQYRPMVIPGFVLVVGNLPPNGQFVNGTFIPPVDAPYIPGLDEPSDSEDDLPELINDDDELSDDSDIRQFFMNLLRRQHR